MNHEKKDKELRKTDKTVFVPVVKVRNVENSLKLTSYGKIAPNIELNVSFEVQGQLQRGDLSLKPGTNFKKGQLLYTVDYQETLLSLKSRKTALSNLVISILADIEMDYPADHKKWLDFLEGIDPNKQLPELPKMTSQKEKMFITSRSILTEYYTLKSQEVRLEKYRFFAPFNGTVLEVYLEPGSIVNPGGQIARIAKSGDFEVKVPIGMDVLDIFRNNSNATFYDAHNTAVATGKILRISDVINQQTQSADVYYSIKAIKDQSIYNGMYLNVSIDKKSTAKTMTLPRVALNQGKVRILEKNKLTEVPVQIINSIPDSVYITGLKDGQFAILEQVETIDSTFVYKPILR